MEELDRTIDAQIAANYAGFWKRYAAMIIDSVIVIFFASGPVHRILRDSLNWEKMFSGEFGSASFSMSYGRSEEGYFFLGYLILIFIVRWCYYAGMESSPLRGTVGKLVVGIYVADMNGNRLSFERATKRYLWKIVSSLIINIGYIMAAFTDKKQALHDQMSMCLVMSK